MAIIYSYPINDDIQPSDELVGTTKIISNGKLKTVTRNFLLQDLAEFFTLNGDFQKKITLTTLETSGPATLDEENGVLNIPQYSGGGATNLGYTPSPTNGIVTSDTGEDATLPLADGTNAGLLTPAEKTKISNSVPYTGAVSDVNLGEFGIQLGNLEFDNSPTSVPTTAGSMCYNDTDGTLDLKLKGGNVTLQIGQEQVIRVVNKTATNIDLLESNYQAVRVTGAQGQRMKVDLAQATSDVLSAETIGLVTETIVNNQEGFITTSGLVRNINTTGSLQSEMWLDGDILYLSPTVAGQITKVKPTAPNHLIIIGYVVHAHITQGTIFVKVDNGYELDELHNVKITTAANNNVLAYTSATDIWENKTVATVLGFTPANDSNKQNSLTIDGTGTKFPTVDAVNAGLISSQYWTKTGDDIRNNNIGHTQVKMVSGKQLQFLNSANTLVGFINEFGVANFGSIAAVNSLVTIGPIGSNIQLKLERSQASFTMIIGNPNVGVVQPFTQTSTNFFGTSYVAGSAEASATAAAEHSFNIGNSIGNGITSGIFRIGRTRLQSTVPIKYASDLSLSYDDRTLIDKGYLTTSLSTKENSLGNPLVDGYVLSSTTLGVRSWIAMTGGGVTPTLQQVTTAGRTTSIPVIISVASTNIGLDVTSVSNSAIYASSSSAQGIIGYSNTGIGIVAETGTGIGLQVNGDGSIAIETNLQNSNKGLVINSLTASTGNFIDLNKNGVNKLTVNQAGELTATKLIKSGGLATQYLMADGSTSTGSGGSVSLSAIGTTPNANAATLTGSVLNLEPASASFGGVVTTGVQTFAGAKTFTTSMNATVSTGDAITGTNTTTGTGVTGNSEDGAGVYATSVGGDGIQTFSEDSAGIYSSSVNSVSAIFNTNSAASNIVEFKKNSVNQAFVANDGKITANSFIKSGGSPSQYLMADGSTTTGSGGSVSLSAIGTTPNANAATITGSVLNLQPASASFGGVVTTGTQTFAGNKNFIGTVDINLSANALKITSDQGIALDVVGGNNTASIAKFTRVIGSVEVARIDNNGLKLQLETASTIASFDANKNVVSLPLATYPSLSELINVKNVTSPIQDQFSGKQNTLVSATNIKTINGNSLLGSGDLVVSGGGVAPQTGTIIVTSGTTFTVPTGVGITTSTIFNIELVGGGGGAGSVLATAGASGSGGGGGGYCFKTVTGLSPGNYTCAIGVGGAQITAGTDTTFTILGFDLLANGGGGGVNAISSNGGAGGGASDGDINIAGQSGDDSTTASAAVPSARGGSSPKGWGVGGAGVRNTLAGKPGNGYGAGGGAGKQNATAGTGSNGIIFAQWFNQ